MLENKQKVFVITPLTDEHRRVVKALRDKLGLKYEIFTSENIPSFGNIMDDIIQGILSADVVIADVTGNNSNVMYELSIAHCYRCKVIMITHESRNNLAFDIRQYRVLRYSLTPDGLLQLAQDVEEAILHAQDDGVVFSNPVSDYLARFSIKRSSLQVPHIMLSPTAYALNPIANEKGLLDYATGLEQNAETIQAQMKELVEDANIMSQEVISCIQEAQLTNKRGVPMTASFVCGQAKKIAKFIKTFSDSVATKNEQIRSAWSQAKDDFRQLCTSPTLLQYVNAAEVGKAILQKLPDVHQHEPKTQLQELKAGLRRLNGFQKDLTRASRALDTNLTEFISTYDLMLSDVNEIKAQAQRMIQSEESTSE